MSSSDTKSAITFSQVTGDSHNEIHSLTRDGMKLEDGFNFQKNQLFLAYQNGELLGIVAVANEDRLGWDHEDKQNEFARKITQDVVKEAPREMTLLYQMKRHRGTMHKPNKELYQAMIDKVREFLKKGGTVRKFRASEEISFDRYHAVGLRRCGGEPFECGLYFSVFIFNV